MAAKEGGMGVMKRHAELLLLLLSVDFFFALTEHVHI